MAKTFKPAKCPPGCAYAMRLHNSAGGELLCHCGYILITGESRGCNPGPGCKRYRIRKKRGNTSILLKKNGPRFQWDEPKGKKMWREGKTDREIADALGVDRETIGKTRRRKWMKEDANG